ncbi:hypothetical protein O6H91_17G037900 [Diphasiastrum complanatum]|nr:hypothetical protein O6H91_Y395900 [Diphasiastrum complanatum]KAJ7525139.1 hypothetical protein O6H91_17G037900 [Diphasiastrum complanatum]
MVPGGVCLDASQPLSNSTALREIMKYVEYAEEVPFARPLPHFPVPKKRTLAPSFAQLGEEPPGPHIPAWLPAFPDPHTYRSTPVWNEMKSDLTADKLEQARQRRRAERSLISLHQRLSSTGDGISGSRALFPASSFEIPQAVSREQESMLSKMQDAEGTQGKGKGKRSTASHNPFLSPPLPPGAREVSPVSFRPLKEILAKKDSFEQQRSLSLLDAFAPVLNAVNIPSKDAEPSKDTRKSSVLDAKDRPPVFLTFDFGRKAHSKAMAAQLSLGARTQNLRKGKGKAVLQEEDKDEKKKRAEQILAQADDRVDDVNS